MPKNRLYPKVCLTVGTMETGSEQQFNSSLERLEYAMKIKGIRRKDLARVWKVSMPNITMLMSKRVHINRTKALALEATYGINADWILNGQQAMIRDASLTGSRQELRGFIFARRFDNLCQNLQKTAHTLLHALIKFKNRFHRKKQKMKPPQS